MKALILAAFVIIIGLASCGVTQPNERVYYSQERVYSAPYDPYYNTVYDNRYSTRRVYDSNTGRYYDVAVYSAPYDPYYNPGYSNRTYRRDNNYRDYNTTQQQPRYEQPSTNQPAEKRLPDGTRVSPDGTITLPNGEVRRRQ